MQLMTNVDQPQTPVALRLHLPTNHDLHLEILSLKCCIHIHVTYTCWMKEPLTSAGIFPLTLNIFDPFFPLPEGRNLEIMRPPEPKNLDPLKVMSVFTDPYVDTGWQGHCIQEAAFLVESQSEGNCNVRAWSNCTFFKGYGWKSQLWSEKMYNKNNYYTV